MAAGIMVHGRVRVPRLVVPVTAVASVASSVLLAQYASWLPAPFRTGGYTIWPQLVNGFAGVGFSIGAAALYRAYNADGERDDLVLASHTTLFAVSALLFGISQVWDAKWWLWHGCRAAAYGIVAADGYVTVRRLFRRLISTNTSLAERVREKTAAVVAADERLRMAVDVAQLGVFEIDAPTATVDADPHLQRALVLPAQPMHIMAALDCVSVGDRERLTAAVAEHYRARSARMQESFRLVGADGRERWVDVSARA